MEKLDPKKSYTWDELIEKRTVIKHLADKLDVNQDYLIYQTNFIRGVTINNKFLAISEINKAIERLKELI